MGRVGRRDSLRALAAARDHGINFFDTARSYGYGESESLLGEFLKGHRHTSVVCTKSGILPPARGGWKQRVKPLAQAAVRLFPGLRAHARRHAGKLIVPSQFSVPLLHASLETSLRELRTDFVDILLLHAAPMSVLQQDDLFEALARIVESGKARLAGISGDHDVIAAVFHRRPHSIATAQFALNLDCLAFTRELSQPVTDNTFIVANHPFGGTSGVGSTVTRIEALRTAPTLPEALRDKITPADPDLVPEVLFNVILSGTGVSAVVPAMMRLDNIRRNVRAIDHCRFTDHELELLRAELIRSSAPPGDPPDARQAPSV